MFSVFHFRSLISENFPLNTKRVKSVITSLKQKKQSPVSFCFNKKRERFIFPYPLNPNRYTLLFRDCCLVIWWLFDAHLDFPVLS